MHCCNVLFRCLLFKSVLVCNFSTRGVIFHHCQLVNKHKENYYGKQFSLYLYFTSVTLYTAVSVIWLRSLYLILYWRSRIESYKLCTGQCALGTFKCMRNAWLSCHSVVINAMIFYMKFNTFVNFHCQNRTSNT